MPDGQSRGQGAPMRPDASPAVKVVGFHVEGLSPSPRQKSLLSSLNRMESTTDSRLSPVIILPPTQAGKQGETSPRRAPAAASEAPGGAAVAAAAPGATAPGAIAVAHMAAGGADAGAASSTSTLPAAGAVGAALATSTSSTLPAGAAPAGSAPLDPSSSGPLAAPSSADSPFFPGATLPFSMDDPSSSSGARAGTTDEATGPGAAGGASRPGGPAAPDAGSPPASGSGSADVEQVEASINPGGVLPLPSALGRVASGAGEAHLSRPASREGLAHPSRPASREGLAPLPRPASREGLAPLPRPASREGLARGPSADALPGARVGAPVEAEDASGTSVTSAAPSSAVPAPRRDASAASLHGTHSTGTLPSPGLFGSRGDALMEEDSSSRPGSRAGSRLGSRPGSRAATPGADADAAAPSDALGRSPTHDMVAAGRQGDASPQRGAAARADARSPPPGQQQGAQPQLKPGARPPMTRAERRALNDARVAAKAARMAGGGAAGAAAAAAAAAKLAAATKGGKAGGGQGGGGQGGSAGGQGGKGDGFRRSASRESLQAGGVGQAGAGGRGGGGNGGGNGGGGGQAGGRGGGASASAASGGVGGGGSFGAPSSGGGSGDRAAVVRPPRASELFWHLPAPKTRSAEELLARAAALGAPLPAVKLGLAYADGSIRGSNARVLALLGALAETLATLTPAPGRSWGREAASALNASVAFLVFCRPLSPPMGSAIKAIKAKIEAIRMEQAKGRGGRGAPAPAPAAAAAPPAPSPPPAVGGGLVVSGLTVTLDPVAALNAAIGNVSLSHAGGDAATPAATGPQTVTPPPQYADLYLPSRPSGRGGADEDDEDEDEDDDGRGRSGRGARAPGGASAASGAGASASGAGEGAPSGGASAPSSALFGSLAGSTAPVAGASSSASASSSLFASSSAPSLPPPPSLDLSSPSLLPPLAANPSALSAADAASRDEVLAFVSGYASEKVVFATRMVAARGAQLLRDGESVVTFGFSSAVLAAFEAAAAAGVRFGVTVIDARPLREGRAALARLASVPNVTASYASLEAVGFALHGKSAVFLGAGAVLSNGAVLARAGTAAVAAAAAAAHVPVVVLAETHKFHPRVQLDSFSHNELGDPAELLAAGGPGAGGGAAGSAAPDSLGYPPPHDPAAASVGVHAPARAGARGAAAAAAPAAELLNLRYDATPAEDVSMVVTEVGAVPPTSVPAILREYRVYGGAVNA